MPGIRQDNPVGDGWEYSLDNTTWQSSPLFRTDNGKPFNIGHVYTVFSRNLPEGQATQNSIVYKEDVSRTSDPVTLDAALRMGASTSVVPIFESGIVANLPALPAQKAIQTVVVGADGTLYAKDGSPLMELDTLAKKNAFLFSLLDAVQPESALQDLFCKLAARCVINAAVTTHRFRAFRHFIFVNTPVLPLSPLYIGRYDLNNCVEFSGWFVDINNPNVATSVRIERDGVVVARITATRLRDDVRQALILQGKLPVGASFNTYGFVYLKTDADKDGKPHTFKAYGGTSTTVASTDGGIPETVTCGTTTVDPPVVNPPAVNNPPRISGVYKDQEVRTAGDYLLENITGVFADDGALKYSATMGDGTPLWAGIVFTPGNAQPFKILSSFPNQQVPLTLIATDTANQSTPKTFLLTVARPVVISEPATLVSRAFGGDTECIEGNGARVKIINTLSNGAQSDYNGAGSYRIIPFYPNGMVITTDANAVGVITTQETITDDVPVTLEFKFPDESVITGQFWIRNKTVATSPVVQQIINNIRVPEGSGGTVQLYDVHQDGNWSEVTNSTGGRFELVGQYPNGMTISQSNTGRAQVQTAGNSITGDVDVTVRYTPASGPVVEGIITVVNQTPPTTENPTPDQKPYVEKFAVYIDPQASSTALTYFFFKVVNVPASTTIELSWPEFNQRTGNPTQYFGTKLGDKQGSLPDGYKDYNLLNGLLFMPSTLFQSHSVQHIKIRVQGSTELFFETTFDTFGLKAGQAKQFYPL